MHELKSFRYRNIVAAYIRHEHEFVMDRSSSAARTFYKYVEFSLKDFPSKKPHSLLGFFSLWGLKAPLYELNRGHLPSHQGYYARPISEEIQLP